MAVQIGDKAPEFLGADQDGKEVKMSDYKGRKVALYFCPKDSTSGYTAEACSLRGGYQALQTKGFEIIGVSKDNTKSHQGFIQKQNLPFRSIANTDTTLQGQLDVWAEKKAYGRSHMGTLRTTFIVSEEGIATNIIRPKEVKTKNHANQILNLQGTHMAKEENLFKEKAREESGEPAVSTGKLKALRVAMDKIEENYEKGSVMKLGNENIEDIGVIPTGSIVLNAALGVGGYPKGRIVEIYGPESSGRAIIAIHTIVEAQKRGGITAFIDAEHAFDRFYARKLSVDAENLQISQPDSGEQALEIVEQLVRSSAVDIIAIDSTAALTPKAEIGGDIGDSKMGLQACLMSQVLRKLTVAANRMNAACIFINQLRGKIDVMLGNPETTTGGNASKFYASIRLDTRSTRKPKGDDEIKGNRVRVRVIKNKVAPPFRKAEFDIMFGQGIPRSGEVIGLGSGLNIVKKSGSRHSYNDTKSKQGRDTVEQCVEDNLELADELSELIFEVLKANKQSAGAGTPHPYTKLQ